MRRQRLNFALPQPIVKLKGRAHGILVLTASVALAAVLMHHYTELAGEIELVEARIGSLTRLTRPGRTAPASREQIAEEVRRANRAAAQLTIPWDDLFDAVESATDNKRVALLALQPNFQKRELKISGEAEEFGAIIEYIGRLERGEALGEVRLISHEVMSRQSSSGIRFELMAKWRVRA